MDFRELVTASGIALRNVAGTFVTTLTSSATANRNIQYPDKDGTIALTSDVVSAGASTPWTPTLTGLTIGNGTLTCSYKLLTDKIILIRFQLVFGTTTAVSGGGVTFTLPSGLSAAASQTTGLPIGQIAILDISPLNTFEGSIKLVSSTTASLNCTYAIPNYCYTGGILSTNPVALTTGDKILGTAVYEIA